MTHIRARVHPFLIVAWFAASEHHKDGSLHRHIVFDLGEGARLSVTDPRLFDFQGRHPNIGLCKTWRGSVIYLHKEDDFVSDGFDVDACLKKKGKLCDDVAQLVAIGGASLVAKEQPGYFMLHKRQVEEYERFLAFEADAGSMTEPTDIAIEDGGDVAGDIFDWVESAVKATEPEGQWPIGKRGLWLVGPTCMGKSIFVNKLAERVPCYFQNVREEFCNDFNPSRDRIVVFDEFRGELPLGFVLQMAGGGNAVLRTKGSQVRITGHRPVIVTANSFPQELYGTESTWRRTALLRRFLVINIRTPFKLVWS